jgi:hypothetical protein
MEKTPCNAHAFEQERDTVVEQVVEKFNERSRVGIEKYGATLDRDDLSLPQWLTHLQEELMDATLYIQKLKNDLEQNSSEVVITRESWESADKITHEGFVYVKYKDLSQI